MSLETKITCDRCGNSEIGTNRTSLWRDLSRKGWTKGDKPRVFYCGECSAIKGQTHDR